MPSITTLIAIAGVAASVGGIVMAKMDASKQAAAAAKKAKLASAALQAKRPSDDTEAKVKLATRDKELKRGKGSKAKRDKETLMAGGLEPQSASAVGGLS